MRVDDARLNEALEWSVSKDLIVDVYHGTDLVLADVKFTDYRLSWDLRSNIKASGSGTVVHESVKGESLLPAGVNGVLSPFRARLLVAMDVVAGEYTRRVQLGWFRVMKVPGGSDQTAIVNGVERVMTSTVRVEFESLDTDVFWAGFRQEEQPPTLDGYDELRRIGILPVRETVPDFTLPSGLTWEARNGGRLDAVHKVASAAGCVPVVDARGAWVLVPSDPALTPVHTLQVGEFGTVIDFEQLVDSDGIYNEVVGEFESEAGEPIRSVRTITAGPLSTSGAWLRKTLYFSSPVIKTQTAADAAVITRLAGVSGSQVYDVPVSAIVNPVVEIGDVVAIADGVTVLLVGQVVSQAISEGELMDLVLRVKVTL